MITVGTRLRNVKTGNVVVVRERKGTDDGWWVDRPDGADSGGVADSVIADGSFVADHPLGDELIAAERRRHIEEEGWTPDHDDQYTGGQLVQAAVAYLLEHPDAYASDCGDEPNEHWPWDAQFWKPDGGIRTLVKAGALIAAEIDRLQRRSEAARSDDPQVGGA